MDHAKSQEHPSGSEQFEIGDLGLEMFPIFFNPRIYRETGQDREPQQQGSNPDPTQGDDLPGFPPVGDSGHKPQRQPNNRAAQERDPYKNQGVK